MTTKPETRKKKRVLKRRKIQSLSANLEKETQRPVRDAFGYPFAGLINSARIEIF